MCDGERREGFLWGLDFLGGLVERVDLEEGGKWKELMEEVEGESQAQLNEEGLVRNLELYIAGKKAHPLHLGRLVHTIFLISTLF